MTILRHKQRRHEVQCNGCYATAVLAVPVGRWYDLPAGWVKLSALHLCPWCFEMADVGIRDAVLNNHGRP
jgi:hypothetical protein